MRKRVMWQVISVSEVVVLVGAMPASAQNTNTFPATGNAGIGTLSPNSALHINAGTKDGLMVEVDSGAPWAFRIQNRAVSTDYSKAFSFYQDDGGGATVFNNGARVFVFSP